MMKKSSFAAVVALLLALMAACTATPAPVSETPAPVEQEAVMEQEISIAVSTTEPVATEEPVEELPVAADDQVDTELADKGNAAATATNVSLTTGLPVPEGTVYHPICVMIENSPMARPQNGLMLADIIYMAPVESMITRMMCIFNDKLPENAGPVRSLRLQFLNIQREWDAPLVHVGGPGSGVDRKIAVYGANAKHLKIRFDLKKAGTTGLYFYEGSGEHSMRVNLKKCNEKYDYYPEYRNQFRFDSNVDLSAGASWAMAEMTFMANDLDTCYFKYNASDNRLYAWYDGEQFETRTIWEGSSNREQFSCQNLIIQHTDLITLSKEVYGTAYKYATYTGTGNCDFFIGGAHFTGTWTRPTLDDATSYALSDGTPLTLLPGNTFIAIHPLSGETKIS